jgi:hypothetical protein
VTAEANKAVACYSLPEGMFRSRLIILFTLTAATTFAVYFPDASNERLLTGAPVSG